MVIETQNTQLEEQKPLVEFANYVTDSTDCIDVGQLAKLAADEGIKIGRNKLFKWLRENGYLMNNNEPYQKYVDSGYFSVVETVKNTIYGTKVFQKTLVTGKGQVYLMKKIKSEYGN